MNIDTKVDVPAGDVASEPLLVLSDIYFVVVQITDPDDEWYTNSGNFPRVAI